MNKAQKIKDLTIDLIHQHYCNGKSDIVADCCDASMIFFGAGEDEYSADGKVVAEFFRQCIGRVPKCIIWDEDFHVIELAQDAFICAGHFWIETDPSTGIFLRQHQRITMVWQYREGKPFLRHMHTSNPYIEMSEGDLGFPEHMSMHSREYMIEYINEQKEKLAEQTKLLERMSYEDSLTGLYNQNKYNDDVAKYISPAVTQLGVASIDLNGLKAVNDTYGHMTGDKMICLAASVIQEEFPEKAYRSGGDEFVIIDREKNEADFLAAIKRLEERAKEKQISFAVGVCWRGENCCAEEQIACADRNMYENKARYYIETGLDRRGS